MKPQDRLEKRVGLEEGDVLHWAGLVFSNSFPLAFGIDKGWGGNKHSQGLLGCRGQCKTQRCIGINAEQFFCGNSLWF